MTAPGFTVWVTGADGRDVRAFAEEIGARLEERHHAVEVLDERTLGTGVPAGPGAERWITLIARLLARHGVATVIALPSPAREVRDRARREIGRMIEVWVHRIPDAGGPGYEPPLRPELEVVLPEPQPGAGAARALLTLEILDLLGRGEDRAASEEEEREVIRRLKGFGYL